MNNNHLGRETSPYLQQHAEQPVDWYAWNQDALSLACETNKPILLSIGYSACHWCHVMARESFADAATAKIMNEFFVNIKVDREERPDLDKIYQLAHAVLTRRNGGWPLTIFLDPRDQLPFFAGTFFPKHSQHGLPAFREILQRVAGFFALHPEEVGKQTLTLANFFQALEQNPDAGREFDQGLIEAARLELETTYDKEHGGFGRAPKFPHPTNVGRALRHWAMYKNDEDEDPFALRMATHTLTAMAAGGLYDHLSGGFYRYSVDNQWQIPHFEKMLYDNGPLLGLYADAWAATKDPWYKQVATATAHWVIRDMQAAEGGYYASIDADSAGAEGKFYVWDAATVERLLGPDYLLFAACYGLNQPANFEGAWHLNRCLSTTEAAQHFQLEQKETEARLAAARDLLLKTREQRVHPRRDEKILTAWNALTIKGMAIASRRFDEQSYLISAERALYFIRNVLWEKQQLLAVYINGHAHQRAFLDDYAFLLDALLELLQTRWRNEDLDFAVQIADTLLAQFYDQENGGFFYTANEHEKLIHRPKTLTDEATPSGNGVAAQALLRLGYLLGEPKYLRAAEATVQNALHGMDQAPMAHASLINALEEILNPPKLIIHRVNSTNMPAWDLLAEKSYTPQNLRFTIANDLENLPTQIANKKPTAENTVYICKGTRCSAPITSQSEFQQRLQNVI